MEGNSLKEGWVRLPPEPVRSNLPIDESEPAAERPPKLRAIGTADVTVFRSRHGIYVVVAEMSVHSPELRGQEWHMRSWLELVDSGGVRIERVGPMTQNQWQEAISVAASASSKNCYRDEDISLSSICWHTYGRIATAINERLRIESNRSLIERHPVPTPTEFGISILWKKGDENDTFLPVFYFDGEPLIDLDLGSNGVDADIGIRPNTQTALIQEVCELAIDRFVLTALDRELISMRARLISSGEHANVESHMLETLDRMAARLREVRHPVRPDVLRTHLDTRLHITRDADAISDDLTLMSESISSRISLRIATSVTDLGTELHGLGDYVQVLLGSAGALESRLLEFDAKIRNENVIMQSYFRRNSWIQHISIMFSLGAIAIGVITGFLWQLVVLSLVFWAIALLYSYHSSTPKSAPDVSTYLNHKGAEGYEVDR